jgi:hypothetical protein
MEMWQKLCRLKISCDFAVLYNVMRNKGRFLVVVPSESDRRVVVICLTLTTSNPRVSNPSEISSAGVLGGGDISLLLWAFGTWKRRSSRIGCYLKVRFDGFEMRHDFGDDSGSVFGVAEHKFAFDNVFQLPLQMNQVAL